jgi:hypothetical protein
VACLAVLPTFSREQPGFHWRDFQEILQFNGFLKIFGEKSILIKIGPE